MTLARKISYLLVALLLLVVIVFHMGHVLLAALFAFMFMEVPSRLLRRHMPRLAARWLAVISFLGLASFLIVIFGTFIKQTILTIPRIVETALPKILEMAGSYQVHLPFNNFQELQELVNTKLMGNAVSITKASTFLTIEVFNVIMGVAIAVFFFASGKTPVYKANLFDAVRKETNERIRKFMYSFLKVLGGQLVISAINAALTAIFINIIALPHVAFLTTMTFVVGLMPILGNIISNTIIVITA
ncbi:MAG TPA: AI-2E family transporter, partial [Elusimicrobiales bacterium]|nr:AI-2E family transporter [Elusimicrobiales bacterium]